MKKQPTPPQLAIIMIQRLTTLGLWYSFYDEKNGPYYSTSLNRAAKFNTPEEAKKEYQKILPCAEHYNQTICIVELTTSLH